jgi:hypothetical protein
MDAVVADRARPVKLALAEGVSGAEPVCFAAVAVALALGPAERVVLVLRMRRGWSR